MNQDTLSLGGGQALELKANVTLPTIGAAVCAFLNSGGGHLVVGIHGNGKVLGNDIMQLERAIVAGLAPKALVSCEEQTVDGKTVWIIEVPAGQDMPYSFQDGIYIRDGEQTRRADIDTIRDMILRRQVEPERWERRFSDANLATDLDLEEIRHATQQAADGNRTWPEAKDPVEALGQLALVKYGRLTNGGDVLFAINPALRRPQTRVRAVCHSSGEGEDAHQDFKTFEGPLAQMLEQSFAFIRRNTSCASRFPADQLAREEHPLYPPKAIREGLVNAFAHRDYADFRGGITINIHPARLEIWNAGDLPEGLTAEALAQGGHLSILRNPNIADVLHRYGMMEKVGRGSALIRTACDEQGLPPPKWENKPGLGVTLTFFAPEVTTEVTTEVKGILEALVGAMTRQELQAKLGLKNAEHFRKHYLAPAIEGGGRGDDHSRQTQQ